ncbi:saccharopine dehydrogenase-like protein [Prauserella shujinwangii]|uniref:Saccharopine dehydrogenase-like protein n=1 Tax=Prauserella shujinwangii TaxID=1453103 RepID=A0A2T0LL21_9PSEU|nr:saccharopine dehydrogenase NADP-binding domain-containing protein [Prauserella shujinwangii]PRX43643.1 saccharopine dehydrogenase-like protein [Prauserella shujinwangii]
MSEADERPVLVAGGYGAVGATVTRTLAGPLAGRVVAAGRDLARATALAAEVGGAAARIDVHDPAGFGRVLDEHGIGTVVLCVEPPGPALARTCLERGVHLVDVGASADLLEQVEALAGTAVAHGATAVLSVGVAPGLTNLLARRARDDLGSADRVDVTVLLGAGERHGADAVRWTVGQLARPAPPGGPLRTTLPGYGRRTAHPFPFSDQYSLRRTLDVGEVTTRLCLDSAPLTALLFALRRSGLVRRSLARRLLVAASTRVHLGADGFAVRADARLGGRHAAYALTGRRQSHVTGLVAAHVTRALRTGTLPAGVHHLDTLPALAGLPQELPGTTLRRLSEG